mmetsp:Transcript_82530/g.260578  ORF Transcript_82530/g.260578 Transcript_82530/m.260578 type:complete len:626 (-) Transcript_82530:55-1932(-)
MARTGVGKGRRPLLDVQPGLASSPTSGSLQGLAVWESDEKAATIFVSEPPGGDSSLWGELPSVASLACGTYFPLVSEPSGSLDVELRLPGAKLSGTAVHPIRVQADFRSGGSVARSSASTPDVVLFLAYMPVVVKRQAEEEDGGVEEDAVFERFCVVNRTGVSVMETSCLRAGTWVANTSVAEETDLRLRSSIGAARPRSPSTAGAVPRPLPPPDLPPDLPGRLQFWIIALEGARDGNVGRLEEALRRECAPLCPGAPVRRFGAWDTRGLSSGTVRALSHELVLDRRIFSQESVLLKRSGGRGTYAEAAHRRASKVLGCALSHSDLWYQLTAARSEGPWVILEDDAVLNESRPVAPVLRSALSTFADGSWDILLLGASSQQDAQWTYLSPCTMGPVEEFVGFWGYAVSKQGALRALAHVWGSEAERRGLRGDIDVECARAARREELRVLVCMPNLVLHPQCGLDPSLGHSNAPRRHSCLPAKYHYRTIQVLADFEFDSTRIGGDSGDGAINMRLVRQAAARVAEFRRAGRLPGEAPRDEPRESDAEQWRVVHARVAKRSEPSTEAKAVGMAVRGARVRGVERDVGGVAWLELQEQAGDQSQSVWMLIHGQTVGLGQLLERVAAAA